MLAKNILNGMRLSRLAICTTGAMLATLCLAGSSADAGVIIPWAQPNDAQPEFLIELANLDPVGSGSSNLPAGSPASPVEQPTEKRTEPPLMVALAETAGGASAPGSSNSGQTSLVLAAIFATVDANPVMGCSQRYVRDRAPQLPQPPLGELLDPPKVYA